MWNITLLIHPRAPESCTAPIKLLHCDSQCEEETCITASTIFPFPPVILVKQITLLYLLQFTGFRLLSGVEGDAALFSVRCCLRLYKAHTHTHTHTHTHAHEASRMSNLTHFPPQKYKCLYSCDDEQSMTYMQADIVAQNKKIDEKNTKTCQMGNKNRFVSQSRCKYTCICVRWKQQCQYLDGEMTAWKGGQCVFIISCSRVRIHCSSSESYQLTRDDLFGADST